jgi:hypothetical protein
MTSVSTVNQIVVRCSSRNKHVKPRVIQLQQTARLLRAAPTDSSIILPTSSNENHVANENNCLEENENSCMIRSLLNQISPKLCSNAEELHRVPYRIRYWLWGQFRTLSRKGHTANYWQVRNKLRSHVEIVTPHCPYLGTNNFSLHEEAAKVRRWWCHCKGFQWHIHHTWTEWQIARHK